MEPFDVFVSYAHADDEVPVRADQGWVTTLVGELRKMLRRTLGGEGARIWTDHRMAASQNVDDVLIAHVRSSRILLLVMSPAYQKSSWCMEELHTFVSQREADAPSKPVFIVETHPVDREQWHPAIRGIQSMRFWEEGQLGQRGPRLLGYPVPTLDEHSPYWRNLTELAHFITDSLRPTVAGVAKQGIWVAEPTRDLLEEHDRLLAALRQRGFESVPAAPYPRLHRSKYFDALDRDLKTAVMFIQLLGEGPDSCPMWAQSPYVVLQAEAARSASAERGVPMFRWRPRDIDLSAISAGPYRTLVTGVETSHIEEFIQRILQTLTRAAPSSVRPFLGSRELPSTAQSPYILVNADVVDAEFCVWASTQNKEAADHPKGYWAAQHPCGHLTGLGDLPGKSTLLWSRRSPQRRLKSIRSGDWER